MATFKQNAACIALAQAIFYARSEYYGVAVPDFMTLPARDKQRWIEQAQDTLDAVRPTKQIDYLGMAVSLVRDTYAPKVVGVITPEAPWGDVIDARD